MSNDQLAAVKNAQEYYNSDDADNFYFHIWGGNDIHIGLYTFDQESIALASERTVFTMCEKLKLNESSSVIDLGAGYGGSARYLVEKFHCHVTCLNLSEVQNQRNRDMNKEQKLSGQIEVIDGSFETIPFEHKSFDLVWSQDAFLHSGKRETVLSEADRVLKPGGEIIFTDPMQADDCPPGVLKPVLDRIHLDSMGSFDFYRKQAKSLGWQELDILDLTPQLVTHYSRVREELQTRQKEISKFVSQSYIERMISGLGHWIEAGKQQYLAWGILHFRKPE